MSIRTRQRWRHHLWLTVFTLAVGMLVIAGHDRARLREQLSLATAHVGFYLIVASLLLGPWQVWRKRPNPVSTDLRRDIGIWGGVLGIVHVVLGLGVHMVGKMGEYFFKPAGDRGLMPLRIDLFGFANDLGVVAGLILVVLVAISSDVALKSLGRDRWKRWQRANYFGAAATVLHGAVYQVLEHRVLWLVAVFAGTTLLALVAQGAGYRAHGESRTR